MGDLRNKARKEAESDAIADYHRRRSHGYTVFHFDLNPKLTRRHLHLGEAVRHLMRVTGTRISFWRCPVRGLALQYRKPPRTPFAYDQGESWKVLHFTQLEDITAAKQTLVLDMLLQGIDLYRGLPNKDFDEQAGLIRTLLIAPPSIGAKGWNAMKDRLHKPFQPLLRTHEADLRCHLLGEQYRGPTGPVGVSVRVHG